MTTSTRRLAWVCVGFLVIAGVLLLGEHRIHALGLLPYLLLLACPLLHYFSHGKHGHGAQGERGEQDEQDEQGEQGEQVDAGHHHGPRQGMGALR